MRRQRLASAAVIAAVPVLLVVLAATPALAVDIRLTTDGFVPAAVLVEVGEEIVWINQADRTHTVVGEDGTWDSGPLRPGESFSIALREPGTVRYATADGELSGVIRVTEPTEEVDEPDGADAPATAVPTVAALPDTGIDVAPALAVAVVLIAAGALLLRRARARS